MKKFRWRASSLVLLCVAIMGVFASPVGAEQSGWANRPAHVLHQAPVTALPSNMNTCYGTIAHVSIRYGGDTVACIMGLPSGTRLARYSAANSQFAYAVAMSDEAQYTKVKGLCTGYSWCAYSSSEDTLLLQLMVTQHRYGHMIVLDFSKYLHKHVLPEPHYSFEYDPQANIIGGGSVHRPTGPTAVSQNGRWAVLELIEYGFVRIDMRDGSYRRVVAPGARYGMGTDPSFELAVSNDGRYMAIVGWRAGIDVYEMDGACGDVLTETSEIYFSEGTVPCRSSTIDRDSHFPGFYAAHMPHFSEDGLKLSLIVSTTSGYLKASLAPGSPAPNAYPLYVALGDSFVSGEGETDDAQYVLGTNTATNTCHVSTRSYPYLLHPALPMNSVNKSCSGSRTQEVLQQARVLAGTNTTQRPTVVSVGVGGNDINVMGKLKACITPGTCEWALPEKRMQTALEIKSAYQKLVTLFEHIQQLHPQATLVVVGYPKVINDNESANCRLPLSTLLNKDERRYMNETVVYLNAVLAAAAQYLGVQFIDVAEAYGGERLCDDNQAAMNSIRTGDDFAPIAALGSIKVIGAESFHPTPRGHELVAHTIRDVLARDGLGAYCEQCQFSQSDITPSSYWREVDTGTDTVLPVAETFIPADSVGFGESIEFSFPVGSFAPESLVTLEIHSDVHILGSYTALADGSLKGVFTVPHQKEGYHTVHAYGQSFSGSLIGRYQVLYVDKTHTTPKQTPVQPAVDAELGRTTGMTNREHRAGTTPRLLSLVSGTSSLPSAVLGVQASPTQEEDLPFLVSDAPFAWWAIGAGALAIFVGVAAYSIGRRRV